MDARFIALGILALSSIPLISSAGNAEAEAPVTGHLEVDGNGTLVMGLSLPHAADVTLTRHTYGPEDDLERGSFIMVYNEDVQEPSDVIYGFLSSSFLPEVDFNGAGIDTDVTAAQTTIRVGAMGLRADLLDFNKGGWLSSIGPGTLGAGNWSIIMMGAASRPYDRVVFDWEVTSPNASVTWDVAPPATLITIRNMDEGALPHAFARTLMMGAGVAIGAEKSFQAPHGLMGFSWYVPTAGYDWHEFTLEGPSGMRPADDLLFLGEEGGNYAFRLSAITTGEGPARAVALVADLAP